MKEILMDQRRSFSKVKTDKNSSSSSLFKKLKTGKNSSSTSLFSDAYLLQKKNKEFLIEEKINNIVDDIKQKISEGKELMKISLSEVKDLDSIIDYILSKPVRKSNDIFILRQFLMSFSNFLEILSLQKFHDTSDLVYKISSFLKKEAIPKNEILFIDGQLGKIFYLILQGEVSVLIPIQFSVKITLSQFYKYLQFLYDNKEYELMRRSFQSNKTLLKERSIQNWEDYVKFQHLLESNLPSTVKYPRTSIDSYMYKFTYFVNKILEENAKLEEERKKREEEEKEQEEEEEEEEEEKISINDSFDLSISAIKYNSNKKEKKKKKKKVNSDNNQFNFIKYKFFLWKYHIVCNLEKGKSFGEVALQKGDSRRTATIITKTDCVFGILERDEYQLLIKEYMEKARKINTEALLHTKLFYNYREDLFESHYFNCFKATKMRKSEYLFKQNEERKYIYFIKKGDVQIELLSTWNDLDKIIDSLGSKYITYNKSFKKLISSNEKLQVFSQKMQKFNISIYSSGEIVGFEEHILQDTNTFMFSAICLTECEIFTLEIEFIEKIIGEKILRDNYNKLITEKKEKLCQRLNTLKSNIFYQYNNLIEEKIDSNNNQNQSKEKVPENLFKNKNKLKIYKKMIYLTPEIKYELNNLSLEKKNINIHKEQKLLKLGIQTRKPNKSLLFSSISKKQDKCYLLTEKKDIKTTHLDNDNHLSLRESRIKYPKNNNSLIALNHPISKINIKSKKKNLKENQKPIKNKTLTKISKIKFSLKGKVPNLLINHASAISTIIDNLISKEKDFYNSSNENRKTFNGFKENKDEFSRKIHHNNKFISHVELLGLDKYIDNIAVNKKKKSLEIKNDGSKSNGKFKLIPLTITTNHKYNFYK